MDDTTNDTKMAVVCLMRNDQGKCLLMRANNYGDIGENQDSWYPPSGHIKIGESDAEAIKREMKEEFNIEVKAIKLLTESALDHPGKRANWWECEIVSGEIKPGSEIAEYGFFSVEETKKLKLWPATKKFFEKFLWTK
jgi:ADP-ribose pyrophosphatase YjhB (NUDIX family)